MSYLGQHGGLIHHLIHHHVWKKHLPINLARMTLLTVKLTDPCHLVSREREKTCSEYVRVMCPGWLWP